jgi:methylaspartate ammonia-lyase
VKPQRTVPRSIAVVGLALTLGLSAACSGDDEPASTSGSSTTTRPTVSTTSTTAPDLSYAGLCAAIAAAGAGDLDGVEQVFDHGPLHELAASATEIDRAVAAQLLVAKEKVEAAISDDATTPASLAADLNALAEATRQAQRTVGDPVLADCSEGT